MSNLFFSLLSLIDWAPTEFKRGQLVIIKGSHSRWTVLESYPYFDGYYCTLQSRNGKIKECVNQNRLRKV